MKIILKYLLIALLGAIIIIFLFGLINFKGIPNTNKTYEDFKQDFIKNEMDFLNTANYFDSITSNKNIKLIEFGITKENEINLMYFTDNGQRQSITIDAKVNTLDTLTQYFKLTNKEISELKLKLTKLNCHWIRKTEVYKNPIEIWKEQDGWISYSYYIFKEQLSDSLLMIHGKTIDKSGRVVINSTSGF